MALNHLAKQLGKYASDNAPAILTAVAASGVVSTAVFSAKGALQANRIVYDENVDRVNNGADYLTPKEEFVLTWKCYLPATITGCVTIGCLIASVTIGQRRAAALAGAVAFGEKAFDEYREQVVEVLGNKKEEEVRVKVAEKRIAAKPPTDDNIILVGEGTQLCYESYSGRYFRSDMESIRKAVNDINEQILGDGYASCNEFWSAVGLETTQQGEEVGWIAERLMDVKYSAVLHNSKAVMVIDYGVVPIRGYNTFG